MTPRPDHRTVARLLAQRMELGEGALLLEGLSRREAVRLVRAAMAGPPAAAPPEEREAEAPWRSDTRGGVQQDPGPTGPARGGEGTPRDSAAPWPVAAGARPPAEKSPVVAAAPLPVLPDDWDGVRSVALTCTRCRLAETRTQVVFSDGVLQPQVMVVGEAPGQNEDETGLPFVGAAGRYLDLLLASVGVSRTENACIANVLKCRPPKNRNPLPDEIEACAPFLRKQVALLAPRVILAVGTFAGQWLSGRELPLGKLRGTVYSYEGTPVVVTYHPAALLRNSGWTRGTWDDLQLLRQVLDGA